MSEETYLGKIEISPRAIASLAAQAVLESYGVVGMANRNLRDGVSELLTRNHSRRGIDVNFIDRQIVIDLYVIIQHGTRISEVAHGIMSRIKFTVEKALGIRVIQVNVHVQGLHVDAKS